ncbi:hypothetical protein ACROYT_G018715 [Oculina patagonica]
MIFQEHTTTDYAIKENSIMYDLEAATVCFFAKDTDDNKPSGVYAMNEYAGVALDYGKWNHVCFTWSSANGDYKFYKDGVLEGSGSGLNKGGKIRFGGTTVIGQDQDTLGGGFNTDQSFVGELTEVNVWGEVLSESDIAAQYSNCHVTQGSVNWWSQFKDGVHGGVVVVEP